MKISISSTNDFRALGVSIADEKVTIYYYSPKVPKDICAAESSDGIEFEKSISPVILLDENKKQIMANKILSFKIKKLPDSYELTYKLDRKIYLASSKFRGTWETFKSLDSEILGDEFEANSEGETLNLIFSNGTNAKVEKPQIWEDRKSQLLGAGFFDGKFITYWQVETLGLFLIAYPTFRGEVAHDGNHFRLSKHPENPVLAPLPENEWESEATFNPAAFYEDGKVYLIYRAVGRDYISVLGYAESTDGLSFDKRLSNPIFTASQSFDLLHPSSTFESAKKYISGGGYGGCEDPRITKIGDRLYLVYVAFNGWEPPRLAMSSILYDNFINHRFLWEKPVLISPPGVVDKSGCLLPEKINGKYVVFHRIYPNILIDFVDNLEFDGTNFLKGQFSIGPRPGMWDSRKVGVGAPPIKTDDGWLLIYQAVGNEDDSKYKVGAMLLDLQDPTKVLYRTNHPIIEPTEHYENGMAKFGVVYPCGAVIAGVNLMVYYGGSDSVTCVATANLKEFIDELKSGGEVVLKEIKIA